jgi:uncharacterized protein YodC (DUF2158 family)
MDTKIKADDTVRLRQGGSEMKVARVENAQVVCNWFEGGENKTRTFHENDWVKIK